MGKTIGSRIKELRTQNNLNVTQFAKRCCLSAQVIYALETGKTTRPRMASLAKIANAMGICTDWIVHGTSDMLAGGIEKKAGGGKTDRQPC